MPHLHLHVEPGVAERSGPLREGLGQEAGVGEQALLVLRKVDRHEQGVVCRGRRGRPSPDGEDGPGGTADDLFRYAPQHAPLHAAPPVGAQHDEGGVMLRGVAQNAVGGGTVDHGVLVDARNGDRGVVGQWRVEVRQYVGLPDVDDVRQLDIPFLHVDDVQIGVEAVGEADGVDTGPLGTLGAVGGKQKARKVNHSSRDEAT